MRIKKPSRKLLYSLREVSRLTGLSDSVIKRWEDQFPQIKPVRNRASNRNYTERDLKLIFYIRDLLYVHKLTEQEVKKKIREFDASKTTDDPSQLKKMVAELKMEINEIQEILNS
jgi:DNA-binding transcriptional MerR regulator